MVNIIVVDFTPKKKRWWRSQFFIWGVSIAK